LNLIKLISILLNACSTMTALSVEEESWKPWLYEANIDLECARLLFDANQYARSLFHLQQANEKLAKGILIRLGMLVTHKPREDNTMEVLGLSLKGPKDYGHRTLKSFLSDSEKILEYIENSLKDLPHTSIELRTKLTEILGAIKENKKKVKELKDKPTEDVPYEILLNELTASKALFNRIKEIQSKLGDPVAIQSQFRKIKSRLRRHDEHQMAEAISSLLSDEDGLRRLFTLSITLLVSLGLSMFLDPLEQISRYPDGGTLKFDKDNPYVRCFGQFEELIKDCLEYANEK